jgi:hypothetical protein
MVNQGLPPGTFSAADVQALIDERVDEPVSHG